MITYLHKTITKLIIFINHNTFNKQNQISNVLLHITLKLYYFSSKEIRVDYKKVGTVSVQMTNDH